MIEQTRYPDLLAIRIHPNTIDTCIDFAYRDENYAGRDKCHDYAVEIRTRCSVFKVHQGEWLLKKGYNYLFKLSNDQFNSMYRIPE